METTVCQRITVTVPHTDKRDELQVCRSQERAAPEISVAESKFEREPEPKSDKEKMIKTVKFID